VGVSSNRKNWKGSSYIPLLWWKFKKGGGRLVHGDTWLSSLALNSIFFFAGFESFNHRLNGSRLGFFCGQGWLECSLTSSVLHKGLCRWNNHQWVPCRSCPCTFARTHSWNKFIIGGSKAAHFSFGFGVVPFFSFTTNQQKIGYIFQWFLPPCCTWREET
jgi:hypothetical protein